MRVCILNKHQEPNKLYANFIGRVVNRELWSQFAKQRRVESSLCDGDRLHSLPHSLTHDTYPQQRDMWYLCCVVVVCADDADSSLLLGGR